jgi:hypothetical protein
MAVDQSTGNLLVIDAEAGTVSRYHPDGTPADFSALGTNVIDGVGTGDKTPESGLSFDEDGALVQIAVDNSGGVGEGDIYVTQIEQQLVDIFAADGTYLGQLTGSSAGTFQGPAGVTVDSDGSVYVSDPSAEAIHKYVPSANPPANSDNTANFAFDGRPFGIAAGFGPTDLADRKPRRWGGPRSNPYLRRHLPLQRPREALHHPAPLVHRPPHHLL